MDSHNSACACRATLLLLLLSLLKRANIRHSERDPKQRKSQPDPQRTRRALEPPGTFLLELPEVHYSSRGLRQAAHLFAQVEAVLDACSTRAAEGGEGRACLPGCSSSGGGDVQGQEGGGGSECSELLPHCLERQIHKRRASVFCL